MSLFDNKTTSLFDSIDVKKNKQEKKEIKNDNDKKSAEKNDINDRKEENKKEEKEKKRAKLEVKTKIKLPKIKKTEKIEEEINNKYLRELKEITSFSSIENKLLTQFQENKLHHALMFSGNYGTGKATFAYWLASRMILSECHKRNDNDITVKMHENLLRENKHPDVMFLNIDDGNDEIKMEQVRKLLGKMIFKSTYGSKFAIIDDINSINENGANALLKTLEEPPENTFFFIINHNTTNILDTIRSRCNEIKLSLSHEECEKVLKQIHRNLDDDDVKLYSDASNNSVNFANMLIAICFKDIVTKFYKNRNIKITNLLNNFYEKIDTQFKSLSRILKISLLERIIMFFVKNNITHDIKNNCINSKQNVILNTNLLQQLKDIKLYELPVKFV